MATKKADAGPSCSNCGLTVVHLSACSRCKLVQYCGKDCQKQHWTKGEHKKFCVAPEQRKLQINTSEDRMSKDGEAAATSSRDDYCAICMVALSASTRSTLPCAHSFHSTCVADLRKYGVSNLCPICRADLPASTKQLFDDTLRRFVAIERQIRGLSTYEYSKSQSAEVGEILRLWREAADQGIAQAQLIVGAMYSKGQGVMQSDSEAAQWYRKAADQGDAEAQYNLGLMYEIGLGVKQSDSEATQWYREAAEQGIAKAQFNLGLMYSEGRGVKQSDSEAAQWYQKAAGPR